MFRTIDPSEYFFMSDLDGTLVDSDYAHYLAYTAALEAIVPNTKLSWSVFETYISESSTETMLRNLGIPRHLVQPIRQLKKEEFLKLGSGTFAFMPGAETFIESCLNRGLSLVVVTNTSTEVVNHMKISMPLLSRIQNWITRDDYCLPKPSSECYELAVARFYREEQFKIGIENTKNGTDALRPVTPFIYRVGKSAAVATEIKDITDITDISDISDLEIILPKNSREQHGH